MRRIAPIVLIAALAAPAFAQPAPHAAHAQPAPGATQQAVPYLAAAGESDLYEIESSRALLRTSRNEDVRAFAQMMIEHHTQTTAAATAAARRDGLTPPRPRLGPDKQRQVAALRRANRASIDRLYLGQQVPAHQAALALQQGYAQNGDRPALRDTARTAVPIVQQHLERAQQLMGSVR